MEFPPVWVPWDVNQLALTIPLVPTVAAEANSRGEMRVVPEPAGLL